MRAVLVAILCCAGCSGRSGGTIRGYVVTAEGRVASYARVTVAHLPPTDQRPPQSAKKLGETTADSRGQFVLAVSEITRYTHVVASYDGQSGAAAPSVHHSVRIPLRHIPPSVVP